MIQYYFLYVNYIPKSVPYFKTQNYPFSSFFVLGIVSIGCQVPLVGSVVFYGIFHVWILK